MLMLKALRHPGIARLWFGQAFSSIGDEVYRVGLTWLAVGLIGPDTGYLTAAQAAALMILSFVGGKWADQWQPVHTMVNVDLLRAIIVLIPVIYSFFAPIGLPILIVISLILSALQAFFDPALQTVLPLTAPDTLTLRAATGLMATTIRLARMVGPALVGFLAGALPMIHFFTLDAITFLVSAACVRHLPVGPKFSGRPKLSFMQSLVSGFSGVRQKAGMDFVVAAKALTGGTWNLAFGLGFALQVQEMAAGQARAFGWVMACYGLGNFIGALYFGNRNRPRPALMMFIGFIWLGLGFILVALSPTIGLMMIAAAFTGFSGTMNEVTFFDLVQTHFSVHDMSRILRLRMATDMATTLVLLLLAPMLFRVLGVRAVIHGCGLAWILIGLTGLIFFLKKIQASTTTAKV